MTAGGILDDLMVANRGDHLLLVVNAACKDADEAHLRAHLSDGCEIEPLRPRADRAAGAEGRSGAWRKLCARRARPCGSWMCATLDIVGADCFVSRSGYTGEDGFEISVPADARRSIARALLDDPDVAPIGLGARDSLRLEAGLCLYGHDIDADDDAGRSRA